jgi:hypothetical protein
MRRQIAVDLAAAFLLSLLGGYCFAGRFAYAGSRTSAFCHSISPPDLKSANYMPALVGLDYRWNTKIVSRRRVH